MSYKNRIEGKLQQNNPREVWAGVRTITGMKNAGGSQEGTKERADELNLEAGPMSSPEGSHPLTTPPTIPATPAITIPIKVPTLWKTSCVVPVPKKGRPSAPKDFRPVALTSHVMKTFERMVLEHLRPLVRDCLDPLQFAYQTDIGVEDAIICLLHRAYTHLERPQSMVSRGVNGYKKL
ncbi:hypothetical protein N1851_024386 [Merluccius polli]|uniref:Reverse transcriptase domain-containing protein n=1 Tax=Merluccius polli TaxID=89951 RepID=A0AA47MFF2_MERPO|nr:hypothetical protein N1851_024386 [Merluccius polli]